MIKRSMFVIAVADLRRSADFYQRVLGFTIQEIGDPGWLLFNKDECQIMAGECPEAIPALELGDHNYFCYLVVTNVDEYFERVKQHSTEILKPLRDEPWGMREFAVRTVDGHRIMIGQSIDKA